MAGTSRRKFSAQFKAEAVQLVVQSDRQIAQVAGELGIHAGTLSNWVQKCRKENPEPEKKLTPADYGRLAQLEEDNRLFVRRAARRGSRSAARASGVSRPVRPAALGRGLRRLRGGGRRRPTGSWGC